MSLRAICRRPDMPSLEFVRVWLREDSDFAVQYAHAREDQAEALFEEILEIADRVPTTEVVKGSGKGKRTVLVVDNVALQHQRLMIDTRKWAASKLRPKVYGERMLLGNDPDAPLVPPAIVVPKKDIAGASAKPRNPLDTRNKR